MGGAHGRSLSLVVAVEIPKKGQYGRAGALNGGFGLVEQVETQ